MKALKTWTLTAVGFLVSFLMFFPILWMFLTAFKREEDAFSIQPVVFFTPTLQSILEAWSRSDYLLHVENSLIAALGSTALALLLAVPAAYSMAFHPGPRTNFLLLWMISTKMMPPVGAVVAVYLIYRSLGWLDNIWGLTLLYAAINLPVVVWTIYAYFREIPGEILEAARVDGAGTREEILKILLPVATPGLASAAILSIILSWNEAFWSLILTSAEAAPLAVYVASFKTAEGLFWAKMSAASMFAVLPVLVMGWLAQRQLVSGLTFGAVK
ncbi:carbohydrate ABC transporter permease (plasmid) [Thermus thermophilus]|nr:mannitol ABC transporter permease [Thermus thermophilus]